MKNERNSSIELLKIIAMMLIVISHVTQTLYSENAYFDMSYVLDVSHVTTKVQDFILAWVSASGSQGSVIFFICSAWFLLNSKNVDFNKIFRMLLDVWIINIVILVIFKLGAWWQLPISDVIQCIFPTTFSLNWYITCYILFYLIHVGLNLIIRNCNQKQLLLINVITLPLYFGVNYVQSGHFFANFLIEFIVIYFVIAYMKSYMKEYCSSYKKNIITLIIGIMGLLALMLITNFIGLHYSVLVNNLMSWGGNNSPFILLVAISLLNIALKRNYVNKSINSISSITLLIYIIHENYWIRTYTRPFIWLFIYEKFGYSYVVLIDFIYSICVFVLSILAAYIYKFTMQKLTYRLSDNIFKQMKIYYEYIYSFFSKIK